MRWMILTNILLYVYGSITASPPFTKEGQGVVCIIHRIHVDITRRQGDVKVRNHPFVSFLFCILMRFIWRKETRNKFCRGIRMLRYAYHSDIMPSSM